MKTFFFHTLIMLSFSFSEESVDCQHSVLRKADLAAEPFSTEFIRVTHDFQYPVICLSKSFHVAYFGDLYYVQYVLVARTSQLFSRWRQLSMRSTSTNAITKTQRVVINSKERKRCQTWMTVLHIVSCRSLETGPFTKPVRLDYRTHEGKTLAISFR